MIQGVGTWVNEVGFQEVNAAWRKAYSQLVVTGLMGIFQAV